MTRLLLLLFLISILFSCEQKASVKNNEATVSIIKKHEQLLQTLPFENTTDFIEAKKGLIASDPDLVVKDKQGKIIWNQTAYQFQQGKAPNTVNPSLWRQNQLNNIHGLFKVTDGVYQLRGFDLSNMTLIEGNKGWIVVDPLTSKETAARAFQFASSQLGEKPVSAIIFTHSHVDHFGGSTAIMTGKEVEVRKIPVVAPKGFLEEAVSENVIAGIVMARRSMYMYGSKLEVSSKGHVGTGLGKSPALGIIGILVPNQIVTKTPQQMTLDGVRFIFQNVPGSEAPAELTFYLPDKKAFCGGEIVNRTMHNLYTLRGAKVRDALKWSSYIDEAIDLFSEAEIYFGTHNWPLWGNDKIIDFLKKQRDTYKFIHDQTIRLANQGLTPREISEELQLPASLAREFYNRGYYGTLKHNSKAVYQHYFGWYDGNPANLDPLPPEDSAKRYMEVMGGAENVLQKAEIYFENGEYRWVAELLNHVVFAEPDNKHAKELLAKSYIQLGYQAESGPWRDVYLSAAHELIDAEPETVLDIASAYDLLEQTPISNFLDSMATRLNAPNAAGKMIINLNFTDLKENYVLTLENAVLNHKQIEQVANANATIELTHRLYLNLAIGQVGIKELLFSDEITYHGSKLDLIRFFSFFDTPKGTFNIVLP